MDFFLTFQCLSVYGQVKAGFLCQEKYNCLCILDEDEPVEKFRFPIA
jgi:hypothetical protein